MAEVEDVLAAKDLRWADETTDRVLTEQVLREAEWSVQCLEVRRGDEIGVVHRDVARDPVVRRLAGPIMEARYETLEQLIDAGWRV